jgi:CRP-like cAMP-binding protein
MKKGESIYEIGDQTNHFFMLYKGKVRVDCNFTVEHITKWPISMHESEWKFVSKKIYRELKIHKAPDWFGHWGLIEPGPRFVRATCATDCTLLVGERSLFFAIFEGKDIKEM